MACTVRDVLLQVASDEGEHSRLAASRLAAIASNLTSSELAQLLGELRCVGTSTVPQSPQVGHVA